MVSLIFAIIGALIIGALGVFYLDLANGPFFWIVLWSATVLVFLIVRIYLKFVQKKVWRLLPWSALIAVAVSAVFLAKPVVQEFESGGDIANPTPVLNVNEGQLRGLYSKDKEVRIYTGIPYAKAPVGELRWKPPVDPEPYNGVRDCFKFAPRSYQPVSNAVIDSLTDIYAEKSWHPDFTPSPLQNMSEDSLYLNVWAPKDASNAPVLVYYHGGSLTKGSSASNDINGETFARNGVVMVTVAYRLGVFGYFAHNDLMAESGTTGNYGLLDQIKALRWVNDNIAAFGGDKTKITIAGESAGSSSVSALCVSPLAKGLFRYAIGESSSLVVDPNAPHTIRDFDTAKKTGAKIMSEFNCQSIDELRKIPAEKLVNTKYSNSAMTIDGYAITKSPYQTYVDGENNETKLINGFNIKEADAFVIPEYLFSPFTKDNFRERLLKLFDADTADKLMTLYKSKIESDATSAFCEIVSVYWFMQPHDAWTKAALNAGVEVYRYQFTKENGYYGTFHSGEIIYAYGNIHRSRHSFAYNDSDIELSKKMVAYWTSFIKTGVPGADWKAYSPDDAKPIKELGSTTEMIEDRYKDTYPLIEEFIKKPKTNA